MGPTGPEYRVVQIHPTRRCNLRCLHCYSSSGPEEREELPVELVVGAIRDAAAEGYNVAGFSGGEPTLYAPLREALLAARDAGMTTTVTTNGMLLDRRRIAALDGAVNVLAISLDGVPKSHNRMRASPRAFDEMLRRLDSVRKAEIPFGFIFTLTQHNLAEIDWVASFAVEQEARLLQIHPLEIAGRAVETIPDDSPGLRESSLMYLESLRIQAQYADRITVQLDLTDRELLREHADRVFADEPRPDPDARPLAELVSPLIVETDGTVVPVQYGFPHEYALGSLYEMGFDALAAAWRRTTYSAFRDLCEGLHGEVLEEDGLPFFNWYERLRAAATRPRVGTA